MALKDKQQQVPKVKIAEKSPGANVLPLDRNIVHYFVRIVNGLNIRLAETIRFMDISVVHFRVLQILYENDGLNITELREQCVITQPVFSRVIKQIEARKLIKRGHDKQDRRSYRIFLTDKGVAAYEAAMPLASKVLVEAFTDLSAEEIDQLIGLSAIVDKRVNPS